MGSDKRVTLSDVAKLAGVSNSTASKVLNGGGRAAPETRQRILETARRLNFRPNALARSFARGLSLTIGVIVHKPDRVFTLPVISGVTTTLGAHDMAALSYDASGGVTALLEIVDKLRARHADGVVVIGDGTASAFPSISNQLDCPVVYAFCQSDVDADVSLLPDGRGAGRTAGEHLIGLGRRRIAHITSGGDAAGISRAAGLQDALDAAGLQLALGSPLVGDWTQDWGRRAAERLLPRLEEVDAIFCGNDQIAFGAYKTLSRAGARIPDDVALVGYDHLSRLIMGSAPFLTTIDPELADLGATAAEQLLAMQGADSAPEGGVRYLPGTLVPGYTTLGPLPGFAEADLSGDAGDFLPVV
ncbi:MAG TPA: LacI family DNA-binding transcriptional regulator [Actinospica sp.]|jgi:LacI family transcriptional regulator|nr:LacI family DNA-binding transcriptional regulator [Actinospica sp.]